MHVLIDGLVFENNYQIGIWRVFYEIMRRTSKDVQYTLLLAKQPAQLIPDGVRVANAFHRSNVKSYQFAARASRKIRKVFSPRGYSEAIWHSTFFTADPRPNGTSVVTLYDMIAEQCFYMGGTWCDRQRLQKIQAIKRSNEIISISHSSAKELRKFYPTLDKHISVIPMGHEHIEVSSKESQLKTSEKYALYVGSRSSYKNFAVVLEAISSAKWPAELTLYVAGPPFSEMETALVEYYSASTRVRNVGRVSDADLSALYRGANCFIFPSLAEGFGIPILEAQANCCMPLVSDIPIFREVAGAGAVYFNPRDPDSVVKAVQSSLNNTCRSSIVQAAESNARRFSWDEAAQLVLNTYSRIACDPA